ncbi:polysaccharide deacetylase family protein [Velocimicrobium porci]|uniref:Polysaccharide deacetylase n=1 Tax=Velocimicrobium porci TaxID=2606634 RepID=A0A6L5XU45_9FIRM|nr:polysaccharide deacetylase family protein [Velocimicrobium porci]MSS62295.1 polysaccharide deacetylase [Velocimicrobium porci]
MSRQRVLAVFCVFMLFMCAALERHVYVKQASSTNTAKTKTDEKIAYLTFDDGPSVNTEKVIAILEKEHVPATFFLIGEQITEDKKDLLCTMVEKGHLLGVHTYCHKSEQIYRSADAYIEDALKTADKIQEVTGKKTTVYRFPWGSCNGYLTNICDTIVEEMRKRGYEYYDWNVSAEDSVGSPTSSSIMRNIEKDFKKYNEPVILMHDSGANTVTVDTLPAIIKRLKEEGYQFATLDKRTEVCHYRRN